MSLPYLSSGAAVLYAARGWDRAGDLPFVHHLIAFRIAGALCDTITGFFFSIHNKRLLLQFLIVYVLTAKKVKAQNLYAFKLTLIKPIVSAFSLHQVGVTAGFEDVLSVDIEDPVGSADGGKTVRDDDEEVLFCSMAAMPDCTRSSVCVSMLEVASSRMRMRGSESMVRANARSCRCPMESCELRSLILVS